MNKRKNDNLLDFVGVINALYQVYFRKERGENIQPADIVDLLFKIGSNVMQNGFSPSVYAQKISPYIKELIDCWNRIEQDHRQKTSVSAIDSRHIEAARIACHVYGDTKVDLLGGWTPTNDFSNLGIRFEDSSTSLKSKLYKRKRNGKKEYIYAIAGTFANKVQDWQANIYQINGRADQYELAQRNAIVLADAIHKNGYSLTLVGHSKGGGEAVHSALSTGCKAIVFNPAGVSKETKSGSLPFVSSSSLVESIITVNDPLNLFQDIANELKLSVGGLSFPQAEGEIMYIPCCDNSICSHSIEDQILVLNNFNPQTIIIKSMSNIVIPTDKVAEEYKKQYAAKQIEIKAPNILLLGQTGVGKSSLVNTIFGKDLAKVSDYKPETRGFYVYSNPDQPVNIIDSEGYEIAATNDFQDSLNKFISEKFSDITKQIHITWYCISFQGERVYPFDIQNIRYLVQEKKIPTCVVFTKCDDAYAGSPQLQEMMNVIDQEFKGKVKYFQVSNDKEINKELDLESLIDWSLNNLNEENLRLGFLSSQIALLDKKEEEAEKRIPYYITTAAGIGASPIPMSDAILLTALQTKMAYDIFNIYGLNCGLTNALKNVIQSRLVSSLGKCVAGNLAKLLPGGQLVGGAINATVAATITGSIGYGLVKFTKYAIENEWKGNGLENFITPERLDQFIEEAQNNKK